MGGAPIPPGRSDLLGARDAAQPSPDDADLALARLAVPHPSDPRVRRTVLRVDARDAERIRVFNRFSPPTQRLGRRRAGSADARWRVPGGSDPIELAIDATTLPGDPSLPGARGPAPPPPAPPTYPHDPPPGGPYTTRNPCEVWVEVLHQDASGAEVGRDVALFTVAPWLLLSNLHRQERVYVVYAPSRVRGWANHRFVDDLVKGIRDAVRAARFEAELREKEGAGGAGARGRPPRSRDAGRRRGRGRRRRRRAWWTPGEWPVAARASVRAGSPSWRPPSRSCGT